MVTVRLFAAARDAAGVATLEIPAGTLGVGLAGLGRGDRFAEVLEMSTLLSDGRQVTLDDELADGVVVDVLPPFAGG